MKKISLLKMSMKGLGGLEKYTLRLKDAFEKKGAEVSLITSDILPIPKRPRYLRLQRFDQKCKSYLKKHPTDIVFGMERSSFQTHLRAGNGVHHSYLQARCLFEPAIKKLYFKLSPLHQKVLEIEKTAYEHPELKKIFCNSSLVKNQILKYYNTDPAKIEVVHNGVEWSEMDEAFQATMDKEKPFEFLFLGNGFARKGLTPLLHALTLIKQEFHLSVVGKDRKMEDYQKLVHSLGLEKSVTFFGEQKNPIPFYQKADVLVIPSYYDPFANVTLEALAMGLFVVSSKSNGASEILTKDMGSIIDNLNDLDAFASALETALNHPKTKSSAPLIRNSVKEYDFSKKLTQIVESTLDV